MLKVEFDSSGLELQLEALQNKFAKAVRPAAQAGAQVLYDEVRLNAPRSEKAHFTKGKKMSYQPGNLQAAIYQAYNTQDSVTGQLASYTISWNKKKAFYGRFVEFGTSKMPAYSFLRKAGDARMVQALEAAHAELVRRVQ
jgi:HK97 gp10 family phage protein